MYRVAHGADIIPYLPPKMLEYADVGPEIFITSTGKVLFNQKVSDIGRQRLFDNAWQRGTQCVMDVRSLVLSKALRCFIWHLRPLLEQAACIDGKIFTELLSSVLSLLQLR